MKPLPLSSELQIAYQETNYIVFHKDREIILLASKKSIEMDFLLEETGKSNYAFITAANPYSTVKSEDENRIKNLELEQRIIHKNLTYLKGIGESKDGSWKEESFCILGITLSEAKKLALEFSQNAFLYGRKNKRSELIYCKKKCIPEDPTSGI